LLQEVLFFDQMRASHQLDRKSTLSGTLNTIVDQVRYNFTVKPLPLRFGDAVIYRQYADSLAEHDRAFVVATYSRMQIYFSIALRDLSTCRLIPLRMCCIALVQHHCGYARHAIHNLPIRLEQGELVCS
jgi:hypothetical protein